MKGRVVVVVGGTVVVRAPLIFAVKRTTMIFRGSKKHVYKKTTESYGAQIIL